MMNLVALTEKPKTWMSKFLSFQMKEPTLLQSLASAARFQGSTGHR